MTDRIPRPLLMIGVVSALFLLAYMAYSRPEYFTSQTYLGGILFLQLLFVAVLLYRRIYFPLVIITFLLAGVDLPVGSVWTATRWVTLGVGGMVGLIIMLRERRHPFRLFHLLAFFAVLAALVSAAVSRYSSVSFLKVLSLLSLFVYASTGARLAVLGREGRFFPGLVTGCEIFVGIVAAAYLAGIQMMGNPNSLGAVMGVVAAPILLWGTLVSDEWTLRRRRAVMFVVCASVIFVSHARASMIAASISCGLLCVALQKYKMLMQAIVVILIVAATSAIFRPEAYSHTITSFTNNVLFKGKDPNEGLLESRKSPWQSAMDSIQSHFWFGTGFGTSDNGQDATDHLGKFSTTAASSTEYGSSYLAIITWVGIVGMLPFFALFFVIIKKITQTVGWMFRTRTPFHPAIPLAMVLLAGLIHATLEDWMFAPGYYLSVFFWSMAFVFVDEAPSFTVADLRRASWRSAIHPDLSHVAPSR